MPEAAEDAALSQSLLAACEHDLGSPDPEEWLHLLGGGATTPPPEDGWGFEYADVCRRSPPVSEATGYGSGHADDGCSGGGGGGGGSGAGVRRDWNRDFQTLLETTVASPARSLLLEKLVGEMVVAVCPAVEALVCGDAGAGGTAASPAAAAAASTTHECGNLVLRIVSAADARLPALAVRHAAYVAESADDGRGELSPVLCAAFSCMGRRVLAAAKAPLRRHAAGERAAGACTRHAVAHLAAKLNVPAGVGAGGGVVAASHLEAGEDGRLYVLPSAAALRLPSRAELTLRHPAGAETAAAEDVSLQELCAELRAAAVPASASPPRQQAPPEDIATPAALREAFKRHGVPLSRMGDAHQTLWASGGGGDAAAAAAAAAALVRVEMASRVLRRVCLSEMAGQPASRAVPLLNRCVCATLGAEAWRSSVVPLLRVRYGAAAAEAAAAAGAPAAAHARQLMLRLARQAGFAVGADGRVALPACVPTSSVLSHPVGLGALRLRPGSFPLVRVLRGAEGREGDVLLRCRLSQLEAALAGSSGDGEPPWEAAASVVNACCCQVQQQSVDPATQAWVLEASAGAARPFDHEAMARAAAALAAAGEEEEEGGSAGYERTQLARLHARKALRHPERAAAGRAAGRDIEALARLLLRGAGGGGGGGGQQRTTAAAGAATPDVVALLEAASVPLDAAAALKLAWLTRAARRAEAKAASADRRRAAAVGKRRRDASPRRSRQQPQAQPQRAAGVVQADAWGGGGGGGGGEGTAAGVVSPGLSLCSDEHDQRPLLPPKSQTAAAGQQRQLAPLGSPAGGRAVGSDAHRVQRQRRRRLPALLEKAVATARGVHGHEVGKHEKGAETDYQWWLSKHRLLENKLNHAKRLSERHNEATEKRALVQEQQQALSFQLELKANLAKQTLCQKREYIMAVRTGQKDAVREARSRMIGKKYVSGVSRWGLFAIFFSSSGQSVICSTVLGCSVSMSCCTETTSATPARRSLRCTAR